MSIEEGNKIIAEFMGLMANPYDNGRTYGIGVVVGTDGNYYADEWISPKYHSLWDWLMPVAFKIKCWGVPEQKTLEDQLKLENEAMKLWESIAYACACINIEMVYAAVVAFLLWHKAHFLTYKSISTQK